MSAAGPTDLTVLADTDVVAVAPRLLGARLRHGGVVLRVTEVVAYAGADDPGSHAHRGRTTRNAAMFGPSGHLYVYFTYGMHHCANVVTGPEGTPGAVLLRAGEVIEGVDLAQVRRPTATRDRDLARGPANLAAALGLDLSYDGADLGAGTDLQLGLGPSLPHGQISSGSRVGVRHGADRPWRFWITADPSVSTYRPASVRRPK